MANGAYRRARFSWIRLDLHRRYRRHTRRNTPQDLGLWQDSQIEPIKLLSSNSSISPVLKVRESEFNSAMPVVEFLLPTAWKILTSPAGKNEDTIRLVSILADHGVDFLDVSSAGNSIKQTVKILGAQQLYSAEVKRAVGNKILVGTVGDIKSGLQAEKYLQENVADAVFGVRYAQKEPDVVWKFAEELGISRIHVAHQIGWGLARSSRPRLTLEI
ncbi:hypothetical protein D9758_006694 [Tetrapyrgos nigripes]|uniref:Uncharacterized protein n=1 Tax=Tetrapyrgos nigripes TaxID=182062 RepID=A0A8H5GJQ5_9AGAR|nr:hypothetical protein D9758_006694 [Tetrapyrgos nigripes]